MKVLSALALLLVLSLPACAAEQEKPACVVGGCSGQLCVEKGDSAISNCLWSDSYRCYQTVGKCERQSAGKCGWSESSELAQCIKDSGQHPRFLTPSPQ